VSSWSSLLLPTVRPVYVGPQQKNDGGLSRKPHSRSPPIPFLFWKGSRASRTVKHCSFSEIYQFLPCLGSRLWIGEVAPVIDVF
jgi:hypothetical protein